VLVPIANLKKFPEGVTPLGAPLLQAVNDAVTLSTVGRSGAR